ncbi:acyltransferase, partial [Streptomyces sp. H27-G5]|nr:acyltransferase [Streptomyces sp. H27-G5]
GLGAGVVWEIGSHPQLTSLARASWVGEQPVWLGTLRRDRVDQVEVHGSLAAYVNATSGDLDWSGVHAGKGQRTITLPTYPFNRQELIVPAAPRGGAATTTVSHPLFDRHYEHRSEGQ